MKSQEMEARGTRKNHRHVGHRPGRFPWQPLMGGHSTRRKRISAVEKKVRSYGDSKLVKKYVIVFLKMQTVVAWITNTQLLLMILHEVCYYLDY